MRQFRTLLIYFAVLFSFVLSPEVQGQDVEKVQPPTTIAELRKAILQVLKETDTPAAGIALVDSRGPVWIERLGLADRDKAIPADEETMFRIGSTSKIFVALAILKLQEQGKLSLKDRVRELVSYRQKGIKRAVYFPAAILSVLHLLVACYFLGYGLIGLRTWA